MNALEAAIGEELQPIYETAERVRNLVSGIKGFSVADLRADMAVHAPFSFGQHALDTAPIANRLRVRGITALSPAALEIH